jgi:hypothetical protein
VGQATPQDPRVATRRQVPRPVPHGTTLGRARYPRFGPGSIRAATGGVFRPRSTPAVALRLRFPALARSPWVRTHGYCITSRCDWGSLRWHVHHGLTPIAIAYRRVATGVPCVGTFTMGLHPWLLHNVALRLRLPALRLGVNMVGRNRVATRRQALAADASPWIARRHRTP